MGVQILWDAENFHPHAQKMIDRILRICKSFLKIGFFWHILFLLFQDKSSFIYNNIFFAPCAENLILLMILTKFAKYSSKVAFLNVFCSNISKEIN